MAKIKSIIRKRYKGKVHDLTVEDLHAYNIEGLSVHNSAVSSLCLYVLGITGLDPIKYDLLFERFLNPDRVSPPDVDVDFDYDRRGEVYNYIVQKYGAEYCCQIGTYNSYGAKAAIRSTAKALDVGEDWETYNKAKEKNPDARIEMTKNSLDIADQISKQIPFKAGTTIEDVMKSNKDFVASMKRYPKLLELATHIEGTLNAGGVHPAGIIVCKDPVRDRIPLRLSKEVTCSQFVGPEVEALGLLKFDLLALKTLTAIDKTLKMIKARHGKDIDIDMLEPNDPEVFKIFNGTDELRDTKGVFQFEADGISKLLRSIRVDRFEDLIVANALYRPGPLGAGMHDMYCNYKHGLEEIKYLHPKMGEVLKDTYGIMVYQENIMKIATHLAGFTRGQADTLRKVVGKKKPELIKKERLDDLFVEGCAKNGIEKSIALKIFEQICYFAGYGFNKCLSGDTLVLNKIDKFTYTLKDLCNYRFGTKYYKPIILDSYVDGKIMEDELVEVFETGEKELYEVELDNGVIINCTLDHKFYCSDNKSYTVQEIMDNNLEILCEDNGQFKKEGGGII